MKLQLGVSGCLRISVCVGICKNVMSMRKWMNKSAHASVSVEQISQSVRSMSVWESKYTGMREWVNCNGSECACVSKHLCGVFECDRIHVCECERTSVLTVPQCRRLAANTDQALTCLRRHRPILCLHLSSYFNGISFCSFTFCLWLIDKHTQSWNVDFSMLQSDKNLHLCPFTYPWVPGLKCFMQSLAPA